MVAVTIIIIIAFVIWFWTQTRDSNKKDNPTENFKLTEEYNDILNILHQSNDSIFITGKAGTGKSTLLRYFISKTRKKHVLLAPTGIAALNIGGQTIHSFFSFPPSTINAEKISPDYTRAELFRNLEMIIIDEVSMVRADLIDGIDIALRKNRNRLQDAFGGVQMVFVGDLYQLPPVLKSTDRDFIINKYGGVYFFDAPVFKSYKYHFKELSIIFRQSGEQTHFKDLLNKIRTNTCQFDDMVLLNSRYKKDVQLKDNGIFLTSKKGIARNINNERLELLHDLVYEFTGMLSGKYLNLANETDDALDDKLPAPYKLRLKKGVQIVMLKNDPGNRWANGSIGKVSKVAKDSIWITIDSKEYKVERETWKEVEYVYNDETKQIEAKTKGSYTQYPLQLAFAMTIHKSQGKTFNKIVVDIGTGAFAHGQVYVALSRCQTFEGISLNNPINDKDIIVDPRIIQYYSNKKNHSEPSQEPRLTIPDILMKAIKERKSAMIEYQNYNGEISKRDISNIQISNNYIEKGYLNQHIKAYCHSRKEEREFKIDRIRKIEIKNN